jgi:hypothetical protein
MPSVSPSFPHPISEDVANETKPVRTHIKRSKSASTLLINHDSESFVVNHDTYPPLPSETGGIVENESSGDDVGSFIRPDELAKTKAARAQSEHRRRVELKESFERLRLTLGVPQPRAGKRDLVDQAILALEYYKQKETDLLNEIQFLQQGGATKYFIQK